MNKKFLVLILVVSIFQFAYSKNIETIIPDIQSNDTIHKVMSTDYAGKEKVLSNKEIRVLNLANQWINEKQYIILNNKAIVFKFETGQSVIVTEPLKLVF